MFVVYCRPSAIPGPVPDEIVLPATESIGLFQLMWNNVCKRCFNTNSESYSLCLMFLIRCKIAAEDGMATRSLD